MIVDHNDSQQGITADSFDIVVVADNVEDAINKVRKRVIGKTDDDEGFTCTNIIVQEVIPIVSIDIS